MGVAPGKIVIKRPKEKNMLMFNAIVQEFSSFGDVDIVAIFIPFLLIQEHPRTNVSASWGFLKTAWQLLWFKVFCQRSLKAMN